MALGLLVTACASAPTGSDSGTGTEQGLDGGAGADASSSSDAGRTASVVIGPAGGTLTLEGTAVVTVTVPEGALEAEQLLSVTETSDPIPSGYEGYSPVYRFEPLDLHFAQPVEIALGYSGTSSVAALFWSRDGAPGYERIGGLSSVGELTASVVRLGGGFVANGVDYLDPPDRSCVDGHLLEGRLVPPSGVALSLGLSDCEGRPLPGLAIADLVVEEDGVALTPDAGLALLPDRGLTVFATLVLDVSPAAPVLGSLVDAAVAFVEKLQVDRGLPAPIGIEVFAGGGPSTVWQAPTLDTALLLERLGALRSRAPAPSGATDLYGAVIDGVTRLDRTMADFRARNLGGASTLGYAVVITSRSDTAGVRTTAEVDAAKTAHPSVRVLAVGLDASSDYRRDTLASLAARGDRIETDRASTLPRELARLGARIDAWRAATYLVGYCSPSRGAAVEVSVRVQGGENPRAAVWTFDAQGFTPGCSVASFQARCGAPSEPGRCGGLGCGACDDRVATCEAASGSCVSYCAAMNACGGRIITNPLGYAQACTDTLESTACGEAMCLDLRSDPANCGACGRAVPAGRVCLRGQFMCPSGHIECDGQCLRSDEANCGACGHECLGATPICYADACVAAPPGYAVIPAGRFPMGSPADELGRQPDEERHTVTLTRAFLLKVTEVTQGEWRAVMGTSPSYFTACGDTCPVEQVSWDDAVEYANALSRAEGLPVCYFGQAGQWTSPALPSCRGYRLPTEAEWEYAARAGTIGQFEAPLASIGWYLENSAGTTYPVARKAPNAWGLYDMHGNVWEWVHDWYGPYETGPASDPTGPAEGTARVERGGSFTSGGYNCRAARRASAAPADRSGTLGFRTARSILRP